MLEKPDLGITVTGVSFRPGFWHLDRFAAAYTRTFGERPGALARASGGRA